MRVDRHMLNWGIFFICLGLVPLAVQQGVVSSTALGDLWRLWPLILVVIGLEILLSRTPAQFFSGVLVAASFGLVFGSVLATGNGINIGCGDRTSTAQTTANGSFGSAANVDLRLSCGTLTVTTAPGSQWTTATANSRNRAPAVNTGPANLSLRSSDGGAWFFDRGRDDWTVALPQTPRLQVSFSIDAGDGRIDMQNANVSGASLSINAGNAWLDLTGASVSSIDVSVNAGSGSLTLGSGSDVSGSLSTNLGSLKLCVPADLGLEVRSSESLSSTNFDAAGMVHSGDIWRSPGYDGKAHKASLSASTNLGSLTLNPAGGCK